MASPSPEQPAAPPQLSTCTSLESSTSGSTAADTNCGVPSLSLPTLLPKPSSSHDSKSSEEATAARLPMPLRRPCVKVACEACRQKRSKCDGCIPCGPCGSRKIACQYPPTSKQSNRALRRELESMRKDLLSANQVIKTLLGHLGGPQAMAKLAEGQSAEVIVASLLDSDVRTTARHSPPISQPQPPHAVPSKASRSHSGSMHAEATQQHASILLLPGQPAVPNELTNLHWLESNYQLESTQKAADAATVSASSKETPAPRQAGPNGFLSVQQSLQGMAIAPGSWTTVTGNLKLVHHLLALYFCWEYPIFVTLSREHFINDFRSGSPKYCSPILVNAILATGCRLSNQPVGRGALDDVFSSGELFFQESERLLKSEKTPHTLPVIQALGIMSLRQLSFGRHVSAKYLAGQAVRLAFEMGLHDPVEAEHTLDDLSVSSATFWGAYTLDNMLSMVNPTEPHATEWLHLPQKRSLVTAVDQLIWMPYVDEGVLATHSCIQPARIPAGFRCYCQLSELIHQACCRQTLPITEDRISNIVQTYAYYLTWYDSAPELRHVSKDSTPSVLFLHIYYHFAIMVLFSPVIDMERIRSGLCPLTLCAEAANNVQELVQTFSRLYTLRRAPAFLSHMLMTACTVLLTIQRDNNIPITALADARATSIPKSLPTSIDRAIGSLMEMATFQKGARDELETVQQLVQDIYGQS